jgi:hypothetical protein
MLILFDPDDAFALSYQQNSGSGQEFRCTLYVSGSGVFAGIDVLAFSIAHDLFNCAQTFSVGSQITAALEPAWIWEGQARYFAHDAAGYTGAGQGDPAYTDYMTAPDVQLFQRGYDAAGFWGHVEYSLGGVYERMKSALPDGANPDRFAAAGAAANEFIDTWASGMFRFSDINRHWDTDAPNMASTLSAPRSSLQILTNDVEIVEQNAYSNHVYSVETSADLLRFEFVGHARISDRTLDTTLLGGAVFCTRPGGCPPCPNDPNPQQYPALNTSFIMGVSGGTDGTTGTISGEKLKPCESPSPSLCPDGPPQVLSDARLAMAAGAGFVAQNECPTPEPTVTPRPDRCTSGCPMSNGDVHIVTVDNHAYDFQAVGEFVLLRTADEGFEIQGRQEPFQGANDVSFNSAIAMSRGGHRIGVYADDPSRTDALTVLVDGAPVDPVTGPVTVGDATITHVGGFFPGLEVAYADGTRISLVGQLEYGVNLVINPSEQVRADAVGLMGPVSADSMGVPALPDGTVIPEQVGGDAYYEQLYGIFEDSWRVTAETTLFDYTDGRTTESYIDPNFPAIDQLVTIDHLTQEQLAAGEAACALVQIELLRRQCIYDVGVTGVDVFGDLYDISADIVDRGTIVPAGQRVRIVNVFWDPVTGAVPLDVYAWTDAGPALITTVKYGEATEFFDPGSRTDSFGALTALVSLQPSGQPVVEEPFNWADLAIDLDPGLQLTYVVGTEKPDPILGGGFTPTISRHDEKGGPYPMLTPLRDRGLLFLDLGPLVDTHDPVAFYLSGGDGCLTQPDFPTLAQVSSVGDNSWGYEGPLAVTPGTDLQLTLHEAKEGDDPFQVRCDTQPIAGPVPFSLEAGQRSHLILYSVPGDPTIRSLILPFGE